MSLRIHSTYTHCHADGTPNCADMSSLQFSNSFTTFSAYKNNSLFERSRRDRYDRLQYQCPFNLWISLDDEMFYRTQKRLFGKGSNNYGNETEGFFGGQRSRNTWLTTHFQNCSCFRSISAEYVSFSLVHPQSIQSINYASFCFTAFNKCSRTVTRTDHYTLWHCTWKCLSA